MTPTIIVFYCINGNNHLPTSRNVVKVFRSRDSHLVVSNAILWVGYSNRKIKSLPVCHSTLKQKERNEYMVKHNDVSL